ncbi:MAG TPA: S24 family peptidase [Candidatus Saccharimonadales bacterium]|nr:S24 family peptidase [Candidatus Saccharimonadales bacterium]
MIEDGPQPGVSIHAGFPNPGADTSLHGLDLHKLLVRHPASTYLFRVRGNAWEDAGVFDGDVAIIDRALDPRKGDVVLWWDGTGGEFAISSYAKMPADAMCWGVVTASVHEFRKRLQA